MNDHETLYPELKYFFSGYFHQGWVDFARQEGKSDFSIIVRDFRDNDSKATVRRATKELEQLLKQDIAEADLREVVVHKLGANVYAPGLGFTYHQWLEAVLKILKEPPKLG